MLKRLSLRPFCSSVLPKHAKLKRNPYLNSKLLEKPVNLLVIDCEREKTSLKLLEVIIDRLDQHGEYRLNYYLR